MKTLSATFSLLLLSAAMNALQAESLDDQLLALFEAKCAECHKDKKEPELSKATRLGPLRSNTKLVIPGDAAGSRLLQVLVLPEDDDDRMPKSTKKKPLPLLNADEIALVRHWIDGTMPSVASPDQPAAPVAAASAARAFISPIMVDELILADLKKLRQGIGGNNQIRYLSLANIYNERTARGAPRYSDTDIELFRTGINKLLNSLSWKPEIVVAPPVDPNRVVFRVDLDAYGIAPDMWHRMAGAYPYLVQRDSPAAAEAQKMLGDLHVMRADYFAFVSAQAPFYPLILGLPGGTGQRRSDVEIEQRLGVVYHRDVKKPETVRAGFQKSEVSQGNRLIERLDRGNGAYYWKSYDFDTARQNNRGGDLFRAPLGPIDAGLTQNQSLIFSHDGGELIFSLPNGLQAYMLIDGLGKRLEEAPIQVVTDKDRKDGRIINGISCIKCHQSGMFPSPPDTMLSASKNLKLNDAESATLTRMHSQERLRTLSAQDTDRFLAAAAKCGPADDQAEEPVTALYNHYGNEILPHQIHSELDLEPTTDVLSVLARIQNPEVVNLTAKLNSTTPLPRQDFEKTFPVLASSIGMGQVPPRERIPLVEFGGDQDTNVNRDEGGTGLLVKGSNKPRKVIRINVNSPAAPAAGTSAATGTPQAAANPHTRRPIIRIGPDGNRTVETPPAPASTQTATPIPTPGPAAEAVPAAPTPMATPKTPSKVRRVVAIGPDGQPVSVGSAPAAGTPAPAAACPPPTVPGRAVPRPSAESQSSGPRKPLLKIGPDGKPVH